ncbi:MAG: orotidine-5'-phosphate decarboxylase [Candidatus Peregrinibacteria bacterium]
MAKHFADKLAEAVKAKGTPICVGLDPRLDQIPGFIKAKALADGKKTPFGAAAEAVLEFNKGIIDAVADLVPVVKPQIAFYEMFGAEGVAAYIETLKYAKSKGLLTIADAKRNDIGSTAEGYARAFLGETEMFEGDDEVVMPAFDADALTVNAYLGWDGIKPFVDECAKYGKGIFVLVRTSNKSAVDLQDLEVKDTGPVYEVMGRLVDSWGADHVGENGYSLVGAVVGATYPREAKELRRIMGKAVFLVPGYGAQGGGADDVKPCFKEGMMGAIVNSSRGITFAYEKMGMDEKDYAAAARKAVEVMRGDLGGIF